MQSEIVRRDTCCGAISRTDLSVPTYSSYVESTFIADGASHPCTEPVYRKGPATEGPVQNFFRNFQSRPHFGAKAPGATSRICVYKMAISRTRNRWGGCISNETSALKSANFKSVIDANEVPRRQKFLCSLRPVRVRNVFLPCSCCATTRRREKVFPRRFHPPSDLRVHPSVLHSEKHPISRVILLGVSAVAKSFQSCHMATRFHRSTKTGHPLLSKFFILVFHFFPLSSPRIPKNLRMKKGSLTGSSY
jgi:hypothetical protein